MTSGSDLSDAKNPATANVARTDLAGRAPHPTYQRKNITSDDLIADLNRIGNKLADCVKISEAVLPLSKPSGFPMGLRNAGHVFQQHMLKTFQIQSGPAPAQLRSPDCGEWQTPKKTLRPRQVIG